MFNLNRLKAIRDAKKLTQQQLSDLSGVPVATIQKQEQGIQKDASLSIAWPLSVALGVTIEDLFSPPITSRNVKADTAEVPA